MGKQAGHGLHFGVNFADMAGMPPKAYAGGMYDPDDACHPGMHSSTFVKPGPDAKGQRTSPNKNGKMNLRGVVEVLSEFGLDPTVELARVLTGHRKVLDRSGNPVLDTEGQPITEPILGDEMRTKVLLELQQYVHPKLKAVEMTVKKAELTDEQVEARLQQLLAKAAAKD